MTVAARKALLADPDAVSRINPEKTLKKLSGLLLSISPLIGWRLECNHFIKAVAQRLNFPGIQYAGKIASARKLFLRMTPKWDIKQHK